jgi:hypothetical protein
MQRGRKVTSLVARGRCAGYDAHRTQILRLRDICARFTPDARVTYANSTQMLRAQQEMLILDPSRYILKSFFSPKSGIIIAVH